MTLDPTHLEGADAAASDARSTEPRVVDRRLLAELRRPLELVRPHGMPWLQALLAMSDGVGRLLPLMAAWLARWQGVLAEAPREAPLVHARWGDGSPELAASAGARAAGEAAGRGAAERGAAAVATAPAGTRPVVQAGAVAEPMHSLGVQPAATRRAPETGARSGAGAGVGAGAGQGSERGGPDRMRSDERSVPPTRPAVTATARPAARDFADPSRPSAAPAPPFAPSAALTPARAATPFETTPAALPIIPTRPGTTARAPDDRTTTAAALPLAPAQLRRDEPRPTALPPRPAVTATAPGQDADRGPLPDARPSDAARPSVAARAPGGETVSRVANLPDRRFSPVRPTAPTTADLRVAPALAPPGHDNATSEANPATRAVFTPPLAPLPDALPASTGRPRRRTTVIARGATRQRPDAQTVRPLTTAADDSTTLPSVRDPQAPARKRDAARPLVAARPLAGRTRADRPVVQPAPPMTTATAATPATAMTPPDPRVAPPPAPMTHPGFTPIATPRTAAEARQLLGLDAAAPRPDRVPSPPTAPAPTPTLEPPPAPPKLAPTLSPREVATLADVVQHRVLRHLERERDRTRTRL